VRCFYIFTVLFIVRVKIEKLDIDQIADNRAFVWIWCGSSDGLDAGRRVSATKNRSVCLLSNLSQMHNHS